jgi:two-component system LytT family response regulator
MADRHASAQRLSVLLVDDEPLVRRGLRAFLADEPDVDIIGECRNGTEAITAIREHAPDLVFLDVQMPEVDGFGVVSAIEPGTLPAIVFVTAFDAYALRAFDVHAVDYLLKPFDEDRFRTALARARERIATRRREASEDASPSTIDPRLAALLQQLSAAAVAAPGPYADRLLVKGRTRTSVIAVDDIEYIEAADNYVRIHASNGRHLLREPIKSIEARLDPRRFLRIHRSAIVNVARVRELEPLFGGEYVVYMASGARLTLSRTYRDAVMARLGLRG